MHFLLPLSKRLAIPWLSIPCLLTLLTGLGGCGATPAEPTTASTPFTKLVPATVVTGNPLAKVVVLGDSSSAGYLNSSLLDTQQVHGWASVVAQQGGFPLALPLIAYPGFPPVSQLVTFGYPPVLAPAPGTTTGRDNPDVSPDNLAVPGFKAADLLTTMAVPVPTTSYEIFNNYVLAYPAGATGSALDQALAKNPSLIYLWIGQNDALGVIASADPTVMTPPSVFAIQLLQTLLTLRTATSAYLVVGNIPDITHIAYMTPALTVLTGASTSLGIPQAEISSALNLYPGDLLTLKGVEDFLADLKAVQTGQSPPFLPLLPGDVLTAANVQIAQATIDSYNSVITEVVGEAGGTVVDIHGLMQDIEAGNGPTINGYKVTSDYFGGFYSLDGFHPSYTGYGIIANLFIQATNTFTGTTIPAADLTAIAAADPLFGQTPPTINFGSQPSLYDPLAGQRDNAELFGTLLPASMQSMPKPH